MRELTTRPAPAPAPQRPVPTRPGDPRQLHAAAGNAAVAALVRGRPELPVQRLVVNVGESSLRDEIRKRDGWIIAKDIYLALLDGGPGQRIVEQSELPAARPAQTENVYLVGHGAPDLIGVYAATVLAERLNACLPDGYSGQIKSLSCSTGIGLLPDRMSSGAAELAARLRALGVRVHGAYGIALNHPAYEGGFRTVLEADFDRVEAIITATQQPVDELWSKYVRTVPDAALLDESMTVPRVATKLSRKFYEDLERAAGHHFVPKGADATVATSAGTGFSALMGGTRTSYGT